MCPQETSGNTWLVVNPANIGPFKPTECQRLEYGGWEVQRKIPLTKHFRKFETNLKMYHLKTVLHFRKQNKFKRDKLFKITFKIHKSRYHQLKQVGQKWMTESLPGVIVSASIEKLPKKKKRFAWFVFVFFLTRLFTIRMLLACKHVSSCPTSVLTQKAENWVFALTDFNESFCSFSLNP